MYKIKSIKQEGRFNKNGLLYVSAEAFSFSKQLTLFSVTGITAELPKPVCVLASVTSMQSEASELGVMNAGVMILLASALLWLRSVGDRSLQHWSERQIG